MHIEMVDLKSQYQRLKPDIDNAIAAVLQEANFVKGKQIQQFEQELAQAVNAKHVIACANGTDALQIAMMALDLKPGDEAIVPAFTYVATAEAIALLGLKPVMVDVNPTTFCIDTNQIEQAITPKTKLIVPVHLYGQCANMNEVMRIANKHNLFVIEDTAQAIGALYNYELLGTMNDEMNNVNDTKKTSAQNLNSKSITQHLFAGTIGHIGTTSFFPSKNLGCYGDGGALFTNNDDLAKRIRMICNHGQSVQYVHDAIGVNSRLDTLQAAILCVKLKHLQAFTAARNKAANWYCNILSNCKLITLPKTDANSTHVYHQFTIVLNSNINRDEVKTQLKAKGIPSMIYYPIPLHMQKAYGIYGYKAGDFPVSEQLCHQVLSLPMHTEMTEEMVDYICRQLLEILNQY